MTLELLRVLDDFERAFMALPVELRSLTWIEGVYMIGQKLYALLQARGLSPIEAQGEEFDPFLHEAVLREEGAEGSDALVVVQELQRGYRFHDRVIRPTMVKVGLPPSTAADRPTKQPPSPATCRTPLMQTTHQKARASPSSLWHHSQHARTLETNRPETDLRVSPVDASAAQTPEEAHGHHQT